MVSARCTNAGALVQDSLANGLGLASELGRPICSKVPKLRHSRPRPIHPPNAKGSRCSKLVKGGTSVDLVLIFLESTPLTNFPQLAKGRLIGKEWRGSIISKKIVRLSFVKQHWRNSRPQIEILNVEEFKYHFFPFLTLI